MDQKVMFEKFKERIEKFHSTKRKITKEEMREKFRNSEFFKKLREIKEIKEREDAKMKSEK